jgi:hypothetical protein
MAKLLAASAGLLAINPGTTVVLDEANRWAAVVLP